MKVYAKSALDRIKFCFYDDPKKIHLILFNDINKIYWKSESTYILVAVILTQIFCTKQALAKFS